MQNGVISAIMRTCDSSLTHSCFQYSQYLLVLGCVFLSCCESDESCLTSSVCVSSLLMFTQTQHAWKCLFIASKHATWHLLLLSLLISCLLLFLSGSRFVSCLLLLVKLEVWAKSEKTLYLHTFDSAYVY